MEDPEASRGSSSSSPEPAAAAAAAAAVATLDGLDNGNGGGSSASSSVHEEQQQQQQQENDDEQLNLKWRDYSSSVVSVLKSLKGSEDFSDVTLACAGARQFTAHKVILSACSPYFRKLLKVSDEMDLYFSRNGYKT